MRLSRGALMAKFDLSRAYLCFPICESDRYILGMYWEGNYYVDIALPFRVARALISLTEGRPARMDFW